MPLLDPLPPHLRTALGLKGEADARLRIALASDLAPDGQFGTAWLVVTRDRLAVFDAPFAEPATPRLDLAIAEIASARADSLVGGGALVVVTTDGRTLEAVRYTNARQRPFDRAGKFLADTAAYQSAVREGQTPLPDAPALHDQADEPKRCRHCHQIRRPAEVLRALPPVFAPPSPASGRAQKIDPQLRTRGAKPRGQGAAPAVIEGVPAGQRIQLELFPEIDIPNR